MIVPEGIGFLEIPFSNVTHASRARLTYPSNTNKFTIYYNTLGWVSERDLRYDKVDSEIKTISNNRERWDHDVMFDLERVTFPHIRVPVQNVVLFCGMNPFWGDEFLELQGEE